jgi:cytochrome c peroxidase
VQRLNLQQSEIAAVVAFLKTLAGTNVYTDKKWSTPFK